MNLSEPAAPDVLEAPRLPHGLGGTVWPLARKPVAAGLLPRIGLEDGDRLPDGGIARDDAELVAAARALLPGQLIAVLTSR